MSGHAIRRITLLSFRTFGDYVLKAPFLFELFRLYPQSEITIVTNRKGGQVYPLLDARLKVVVVDHGIGKLRVLRSILAIPRASIAFALDDSRTTLVLSLLVRARRKTGWVQGESLLYAQGGFFVWKSVRPGLSAVVKAIYRPGKVRHPEDKHDAEVELELLDMQPAGRPLAAYRSKFATAPSRPAEPPYIYCAAEAGWRARQLSDEQWISIIDGLLQQFATHRVVLHGAAGALRTFEGNPRVSAYSLRSVRDLFETISGATLVIAPDSFALHLASFYDVPAIGYFGPAHPHRFRSTSPRSTAIFHQPECSPCLQSRGQTRCQKGLLQCTSLAAMSKAELIAAAERSLGMERSSVAD